MELEALSQGDRVDSSTLKSWCPNNRWNIDKLREDSPFYMGTKILLEGVMGNEENPGLIWKASLTGDFSTESASYLVRTSQNVSM